MKKGFTLIELLIVIGLIIIFAGLTLPVGFNFYQESALRDQTRNVENALRKAQALAITGRSESSAGVKIDKEQYVIFEGESATGPQTEVIPFPVALSVEGATEIVFQKSTGLPVFEQGEEVKSIILNFGGLSAEITVNHQGKIERYEPIK